MGFGKKIKLNVLGSRNSASREIYATTDKRVEKICGFKTVATKLNLANCRNEFCQLFFH